MPDHSSSAQSGLHTELEGLFSGFDSDAVLAWYDKYGRHLAWRHRWPDLAPAYHVFLSELMLQQTSVATAIPYFEKFTAKWPDIFALAEADLDELLANWAGLGYYARARNMHKTARIIVSTYHGQFPETEADLRALPGIGPYTAGAILSFAFDRPAIVVDGNIERILLRFGGFTQPISKLKPVLRDAFLHSLPKQRFSDFPQALMDLANDICQPRTPDCQRCPLQNSCAASKLPDPSILPIREAKKHQPVRDGKAYIISRPDGRLVMCRRPEKGLLGGMLSFPSSGWDHSDEIDSSLSEFMAGRYHKIPALVKHVFTHFTAHIQIYHLQLDSSDRPLPEGFFWSEDNPEDWPKLMQKIRKAGLG